MDTQFVFNFVLNDITIVSDQFNYHSSKSLKLTPIQALETKETMRC